MSLDKLLTLAETPFFLCKMGVAVHISLVVVTVKPDGVSSKPVPYKVVNRYFRILCQAPGMHPVVDKCTRSLLEFIV